MFTLKNSRKSVYAAILALVFAAQTSYAAPIVTDGNTATTLSTSGNVTNVTTATVQGNTAFNSFKQFDVNSGKTVNLHLPGGTDNLLNLVHKRKTKIDGILNGYQNGQIGGNVFFLNPYGVAIGANGVVNVGSLTAITPTKKFMKDFFTAPGNPSASATAQVLAGDVPLRGFAGISVAGKVNAERVVALLGGDVTVTGQINAGVAAQSSIAGFGNFVNIDGVAVGADLVVDNGAVKIVAADDVKITGQINVDGKDGVAGGDIDIDAGDAITVNKDAVVSAKGVGNNSDGGEIIILAQDDATLDDNAVIDVSGGASGDGGFIEFSAKDKVDIDGGQLAAAAANGLPGTILLDPAILNLDLGADIFTAGANMIFQADETINVNGVTISSRQIAGADHVNDPSTGDSGDLTFEAPEININSGSQILAHATDGFMGGDIIADAIYIGGGLANPVELKINVTDSLLKAIAIELQAEGSVAKSSLTDGAIETIVHAEVKVDGSILDTGDGSVSIFATAGASTDLAETDIPDEIIVDQNVSATTYIGADSIIVAGAIEVISRTNNNILADLSNSGNAVYENISAIFTNATSDSTAMIAQGADIQSPNSGNLSMLAEANTEISISLIHEKPDAITPSAVMAVSEVDSNAEATIAADLNLSLIEVYAYSEIESDVSATTVFPVSIAALLAEDEILDDLPFTMTAAVSQHNNRSKAGFIDGAVINVDKLALGSLARDLSTLSVFPGASEENTQIKGIIDGDFQNSAELCFRENADVIVNELYELEIGDVAPESIDGLSEVSKKEVTSELGANPMFTKLWRLQTNSSSQRESSYEYYEVFDMTEDSDSDSTMDSDSGSMMESGGDSGDGFSFEYMTESSFDTSSDSASSSSSSSTSGSTSESAATSESSSDSDSSFEFESSSTSSSSSSEDE